MTRPFAACHLCHLMLLSYANISIQSLVELVELIYLVWLSWVNLSTVPVKSLDIPTHSRVFLHLYFLHCIMIIMNTYNYEITHMESCSNQKSVKQIKIYFMFFKVATLCLDDSFAHYWHSLNQLHEVVTWNAFAFDLFNTFLVTTWFHMCYFIVLMFSLLTMNE